MVVVGLGLLSSSRDPRAGELPSRAMAQRRDPHCGPVPDSAWAADAESRRERGRVEIFNATRPGGLDGWTMDLAQYDLLRSHILEMVDDHAADDGTILLKDVVEAAQDRFGDHELFPGGRLTNYVRFTKTDLEARCEVERVPRSSPQRIRRWQAGGEPSTEG